MVNTTPEETPSTKPPTVPADETSGGVGGAGRPLTRWLLAHQVNAVEGKARTRESTERQHSWWKEMCLDRCRLLLQSQLRAGDHRVGRRSTVSICDVSCLP